MSKRKRELSSEEKKLWRRVTLTTKARKPLPPDDDPEPVAPKARAAARDAAPPAPVRRPTTPPKAPPADRGGEKRVRRGQVEIGATLDLHGHTQATARAALSRFLYAAQARGDRAVSVVTGVGRGGEGVLKRLVPGWLSEPDLRPLTAGFAQAHRAHGGAGAVYVFLKRRAHE